MGLQYIERLFFVATTKYMGAGQGQLDKIAQVVQVWRFCVNCKLFVESMMEEWLTGVQILKKGNEG